MTHHDTLQRAAFEAWYDNDPTNTSLKGAFHAGYRAALQPQAAAPNTAFAHCLLSAAAKSGDPGTIELAAQLAGVPACKGCGYVIQHCRCEPQAAAEPVGYVYTIHGVAQGAMIDKTLKAGTPLYTTPPDQAGLLRDALSNLNDIEPVGVVIGFEDDTGHAIVEHACEGPYGPLNEQECIYNSDQLHAFGASERIKAIGECARLIEDEEEDGLPLETLANGIRALLGKEQS